MHDSNLRPDERTLLCHPQGPAPFVRSLTARAERTSDGGLIFVYTLSGDLVRLRIPPPGAPGRHDRLWEHTCCEAFIAVAGEPAYRELNFSPSGQWAAYAFSAYRQALALDEATGEPVLASRLSPGRLELTVRVGAGLMPRGAATQTLHIGLSAVVESADTVDGERSYWALHHAGEQADFHRRETFVLNLPALG